MLKKLFALSLCLLLVIPVCAAPNWTYPLYIKELNSDLNRLVNRDHLLGEKDIPEDLVDVKLRKASSVAIFARQAAADAAAKLFAAPQRRG